MSKGLWEIFEEENNYKDLISKGGESWKALGELGRERVCEAYSQVSSIRSMRAVRFLP